MAVLIAAAGYLLYDNVSQNVDQIINQGLEARAADAGQILQTEGPRQLTGRGEGFAQVLTVDGIVRSATPGLPKQALLTSGERQRAIKMPLVVDHVGVLEEHRVRLLGTYTRVDGSPAIVVVGAPLDDRDETLTNLRRLILVGGPIALVLASLAGFGVASGALRPVEAMRKRAAGISGETPGQRLPTSPANDEVRRLGDTLNEMLGRIDKTLERERAFVSDASHELRTPLAILKGELEVASHPTRTMQELRDAVSSAGEEADRLVRLSEDLLVVARADQSRLPIRREQLPLEVVLGRTVDRFTPRAASAGRTLTATPQAGYVVWGDELRLEQALSNLVDNAFCHGEGDIQIAAESIPAGTRLSVRDHGPGLPDGFSDVAFERFTRADAARGRGGAGLGLAIVKAIAQGHDGAVGIESIRGADGSIEGTTAWIDLPDNAASNDPNPSNTRPKVARPRKHQT